MKRLLFICALVFLASAAQAQTPVGLAPVPRPVFTQNGAPLVNGCLFSFAAGTSTPLATFADSTGTVSNPNPAILDANGTPSVSGNEVGIYLSSANYKFQLKAFGGTNCASGASVWTADNINAASFLNLPNTWTGTQTFNAPGAQDINAGNTNGILWAGSTKYPTAQSAIAACTTTLDCWVEVLPGTQSIPTNIRSNLRLSCYTFGIPSATITAATNLVQGSPPADNKCIFTGTTNLVLSGLWDASIEGITFDFGGNNVGIVLQNGVFNNWFINDTIQNCGTGTCLTWNGGAVAGQSVVGNHFPGLNIFNAGKAIRMTATAPGVAANNTVSDYVINNISSIAIECVQQADTNTFRSGFLYGLGNNATGVLINSATPAVDSGCNDNKILDITTDVLNGGGAFVGTLVQINKSTGTIVDPWSIGGSTNSGTELATTGSPSARVCTASDFSVASNSNWCRFLGPTQIGTGGSSINKVFLGTATLTYGAIAAQTCQEQPLAVTGATANTGVWSASPNPGLGNVNLSWSAHADAIANSVLVRVCNPTVGAITPTAVSWTVSGMQ